MYVGRVLMLQGVRLYGPKNDKNIAISFSIPILLSKFVAQN